MKKLILLFATVALTVGAQAQKAGAKHAANKMMNAPYKMEYNGLRIGNMAFVNKVLFAWKDYDENNLDKAAVLFADDVWGTLADGTVVKGKDNFLSGMKEYRDQFSAVNSTVAACTSLKSNEDPNDEVVVIWGTETGIKKDGTTQKMQIHEVWMFNKAGKVYRFHQFAAPDKGEMK